MFSRLRIPAAMACALWLSACAAPQTATDPQELIKSGWNEFTLGEFGRAVARFDEALAKTSAPEPLHLQALYGLATTWNLRRPGEDPEKARELYEQIIRLAPDHDMAIWSQLALARLKHLVPVGQDPDYNEVRKAYQALIDQHPGHLAAKEAFIYKMSTLISSLKLPETKQAIKELEEFVKDPKTPFRGPAYSLLAVGYTTMNEPEKRLQAEIDSLNNTEIDPANPFNEFAWQYWNNATIAEFECGDFDTARIYYKKLIAEYPTDKRVFGCKQALRRMDELEEKIRSE
jgi:tetratricopeptide (TPR) repeat protein